ncbi:TonB-dependent receptor [Aliifodinibius salipaludis]|uniref:TonB-dependent receptor n=1 Tax=Fodinibius salipaludis TaxID=2032627 RepID=A0A2A2GDJ3_9BACT|nr:TonB-dependent receptor [Aliifodinibius salipaludis]PAU94939.1 TonB-dependent receptor [Aliifodinibius salipaludis]
MTLRFWVLFAASLLLYTVDLSAQTVKVVDENSQQPIINVYIFNNERNKMVSTNKEGVARIEKFSVDDTLNFRHPSYQKLVLSYQELKGQDFMIQLKGQSVLMDDIYVSASKRAEDRTKIPQAITRIDDQQVAFNNPQTSADILKHSGEVFVQKSQMGGGSPMMRGFAANSVLLAVDGIRMNNAIFRSGNLQNVISIDPNAIENTEVLFGPGSIIYGSDALGGVMNFQTISPELSFDDSTIVNVNGMTRYSSANNERTIHADASVGFEKWGSTTSITYSSFDDLRSGSDFYDEFPNFGKRKEYVIRRDGFDAVVPNDDVTLQRFSGYQQLNLMQKIRYKPNANWDLSYGSHFATTSDIPRYDRLIQRENGDTGQLVNAEWYYGPQIWMMNTLKADYLSASNWFDNLTTTFSHQWFQESRNDRDFQDNWRRNREENVNVYIAQLDFDKHFGDDKELYYGIEGIYNYVGSDAKSTNIETEDVRQVATRYPDQGSNHTQLAAYVKYEQDLTSNLTAILGTRYSHVMLDAEFSNAFYDFNFQNISLNTGALSGNAGFTYRPADGLQLNLNASTGFRAPNVDDVAKVFDSEPGTVIVPNADLGSEYTYNLDFAVIKTFGDIARFEVNTFYTWLRDAMVRRDFGDSFGQDSIMYDGTLSNVEAVVNAGKAYIYGVSGSFSSDMGRGFSFDSRLTFTEGEDRSNNEPMRHVAPLFGMASVKYEIKKMSVETFTEFNAKKPISDFSPSERNKPHLYTPEGTPAWATLNLRTSYQLSKDITLNLQVENILDKHYRPYSSGISAPGRNIVVALRGRF